MNANKVSENAIPFLVGSTIGLIIMYGYKSFFPNKETAVTKVKLFAVKEDGSVKLSDDMLEIIKATNVIIEADPEKKTILNLTLNVE